ncbi:RNA 2'-phosphotransferase [Streptomyces sp. NPDC127098]|uniref:RNA 2'-phosphotransferase n=1 Tax=Streptomyces sp. NPDC127098 TaxID=3347137 RepID=UPI003654B035
MDERTIKKISKYLARHLRHDPGRIGLVLDEGGWADIDELLAACGRRGMRVSRAQLDEVVARNDKRRFAVDPTGRRIRASQGHTIEVDLGLTPLAPPARLYHGTVAASLPGIRVEGLRPMRRQHVHLSPDRETATRVGARRGRPVVLPVEAGEMHAAGHVFWRSDNGVWLTEAVPAAFLRFPG